MGLHNDRYPVYCASRLSLSEMAKICIGQVVDSDLVCKAVPQHVFYDSVFVVDLHVVTATDLSTDGLIYQSHTCPTKYVSMDHLPSKQISVKLAKKNDNNKKSVYTMQRQYSKCYSQKVPGVYLKRTITKFKKHNGDFCKYAMVMYKSNYVDITGEAVPKANIFTKSHGNLKLRKESYTRTFPSVLKQMKGHGMVNSPKRIITCQSRTFPSVLKQMKGHGIQYKFSIQKE